MLHSGSDDENIAFRTSSNQPLIVRMIQRDKCTSGFCHSISCQNHVVSQFNVISILIIISTQSFIQILTWCKMVTPHFNRQRGSPLDITERPLAVGQRPLWTVTTALSDQNWPKERSSPQSLVNKCHHISFLLASQPEHTVVCSSKVCLQPPGCTPTPPLLRRTIIMALPNPSAMRTQHSHPLASLHHHLISNFKTSKMLVFLYEQQELNTQSATLAFASMQEWI